MVFEQHDAVSQEQCIWFYFKGMRVYFTNHYSVNKAMVFFLFLVIVWVNTLGESRKVNDKILISSFKQAGATAISKSSPQSCQAEVHFEALLYSVFR